MGVLAQQDESLSQLTLNAVQDGWVYRIFYDSATTFTSRYGETIAVNQLSIGEIVDVTYNPDTNVATAIKVSYDAWEYEDVSGLTYDQKENQISVRGETFVYTASLVLYDDTPLAQARRTQAADSEEMSADAQMASEDAQTASAEATGLQSIALSSITDCDVVTCRGYKGRICSVVVQQGHGYVRLSDYSTYIGGTVTVGDVVAEVTKNMLLTVPVGNWILEIAKDGKIGTKNIVVSQDEEQTVNLADLVIISNRKGVMHFVTTPSGCTITIDGVEYEGRTDFLLDYGEHKVSVSAVGYKAYNGTVTLRSAYMNVNVELTLLDSSGDPSADTSSTTAATATTQVTTTVVQATTEATEETTETSTTEQQ
jgi:hypothetical protein